MMAMCEGGFSCTSRESKYNCKHRIPPCTDEGNKLNPKYWYLQNKIYLPVNGVYNYSYELFANKFRLITPLIVLATTNKYSLFPDSASRKEFIMHNSIVIGEIGDGSLFFDWNSSLSRIRKKFRAIEMERAFWYNGRADWVSAFFPVGTLLIITVVLGLV